MKGRITRTAKNQLSNRRIVGLFLPCAAIFLALESACARRINYQVAPNVACYEKLVKPDNFQDGIYKETLDKIWVDCYKLQLNEKGLGDVRDTYILLNQLRWNYFTLLPPLNAKIPGTLAAIIKKQHALESQHRERKFPNMNDWHLSENFTSGFIVIAARDERSDPIIMRAVSNEDREFKAQKARKDRQIELNEKASKWIPPDRLPIRFFVSGDRAIAIHQFRIEFYKNPEIDKHKNITMGFIHDESQIVKIDLDPIKVMSFKHRFEFLPLQTDRPKNRILVCTNSSSDSYHGETDEELAILGTKGINTGYPEYGSIPWSNQAGEIDQFCGVIAFSGEVVYRFPWEQREPTMRVELVDLFKDETKAVIAFGERVVEDGEDGPEESMGKLHEIWIWDYPDKLRKISPKDAGVDSMMDLRRKAEQL